jgi:hypothetical protein
MIHNTGKEDKDQSAEVEQQGGIDTAGTKGTQSHNNDNEDKPVSAPPNTPAGQEAKKEASDD